MSLSQLKAEAWPKAGGERPGTSTGKLCRLLQLHWRGKSHVRHNAVLDLKIAKGKIEAKVQGTKTKPYEVTIEIDTIGDKTVRNSSIMQSEDRYLGAVGGGRISKELEIHRQSTPCFSLEKSISIVAAPTGL